jgi:sugar phosphate isomerase/epimerase
MNPEHRTFFAGTRQVTPLLDRLAPARLAGFDAISVWPGDVTGHDRSHVRQAVAAAGLAITDVELIGNWLPGHAVATGAYAELMRPMTADYVLPIAAKLGAQTVSVAELTGLPFDPVEIARHFAALCDRAAEFALRLAIEFVPTGAIADLDRALEIVDRAGRGNGGIMLDSWHFFRSGSSLDRLARMPGERIFSVQLNDALAAPEADLNMGMVNRLLPGEGELDLAGFMQALAATGTRAPVGIETFSARLDALPVGEAIGECAAALDYCLALAG